MFRSVGVIGLGVMGGSLVRALAELDRVPEVAGWSPDASEVERALAAGVIGRGAAGPEDAVRGAELVVLAAPLEATRALLSRVAEAAGPGAVLADVASLKAPVRAVARSAGLGARWVGCHPMAGSEASGFDAGRADLFRGAVVWLVSDPEARRARARVEALWTALGARARDADAVEHDRLMALASHLPQLTATALAGVLEGGGITPGDLGPGGRDATRLAASSPEMWRDLLAHAPPELAAGLKALAHAAGDLARLLEAEEWDALHERMERTRRWRLDP